MAYTYEQLTKAYAAVHGGIEPTGETAAQLQLMTNASFTDTDRLNYILNSADSSTAVAVMTYQFFTGKSPKADGIAWLLNSAENPNDLNDAAFANFNLEHRFMNFAASLAMSGEGKAAFEAKYAALTYAGYVASIYDSIIGVNQARAAGLDPDKIILDVIARQDLILASARAAGMVGPNATAAEIDLALKTATAAYLLAEGIKADVGVYAAATNNFMLDLAKGTAVYNTDITQTYAPNVNSGSSGTGKAVDNPPPATTLPGGPAPEPQPEPQPQGPTNQTFTLTAGADTFTGGDGDDTFNATNLTFDYGDQLDGGAGDDSLTITVTGSGYNVPNDGVTNIETVTINSDSDVYANTYQWTGLKQLNVTSVGATTLIVTEDTNVNATVTQGAGAISIRRGHDVTVTATGAANTGSIEVGADTFITGDVVVSRETYYPSAAAITVNGGKTVSITQTVIAAPGQSHGTVTVNGSELTTAVTVKATAPNGSLTANSVTIKDVNLSGGNTAGTITKASIDSYTTVNFVGTALNDLSLAHGSGNVTLNNDSQNLASPVTTLNLALNGLTGGALKDEGFYTTANVTTGAENSTLANIEFGALETLNIAGDSRLTLTSTAGLSSLETIKISGAAGLSANVSGATVASIDASSTTGANTLVIDASKAWFKGGAGVDNVTLSSTTVSQNVELGEGNDTVTLATGTTHATITGVIDGGMGANTLVINADDAQEISGHVTTKFYGFQTVAVTGAGSQTIDMSQLQGVADTIRTSGGVELAFIGANSVRTLELTGAGQAYILSSSGWSGANDSLNLKLSQNGAGVAYASDGITAVGVETVNITSTDTSAMPMGLGTNTATWLGQSVTTINISGNTGFGLTAASKALTSVDASGITLGGFTWISGALTDDATVKGAAAGANNVNVTSALAKVTYTGGSSTDTVTANNDQDNVISTGAGNDVITVGKGHNVIDVGTGTDSVIVAGINDFGKTVFSEITGLSGGDTLRINSFHGRQATSLGAEVTQPTGASFDDYLNAAAEGNGGNGGGTALMTWFRYDGDTYVVVDSSTDLTFQEGRDVVVKLVGGYDLTASTVSAGTLTFVDIGPV